MTWTQELYKLKCQDQVAFQKLTLAAGRELIVWEGSGMGAGDHLGGCHSLPGGHWWQPAHLPQMSLIPWPEVVQSPSHGF